MNVYSSLIDDDVPVNKSTTKFFIGDPERIFDPQSDCCCPKPGINCVDECRQLFSTP
jgi:hypothetical protein